ncbi:MAG: hypothetical protein H7X70_06375 [Candidatus Kapabacteria bacterium]|nr:hypothetical protein [Candidatus Kapabacteria bacterium]
MFIPNYLIACLIPLMFESIAVYQLTTTAPTKEALSTWSGTTTIGITNARRSYIGPFGNDSINLRVQNLPLHDSISISMTLYILGSWDGVADDDRMEVILDGTDTLMSTTFSNTSYNQNYPDVRGGKTFPRRTGAAEVDVTGWVFVEPKIFNGPLDATYTLRFKVPHTKSACNLSLAATLKDVRPIPSNEAWGIGDVRVEVISVEKLDVDSPTIVPGR